MSDRNRALVDCQTGSLCLLSHHQCHSRVLVDCAEAEGRVVLTGDRAFIERRYCDAAYFVRGADKRSQLQEARAATRA